MLLLSVCSTYMYTSLTLYPTPKSLYHRCNLTLYVYPRSTNDEAAQPQHQFLLHVNFSPHRNTIWHWRLCNLLFSIAVQPQMEIKSWCENRSIHTGMIWHWSMYCHLPFMDCDFVICCSVSRFSLKWKSIFPNVKTETFIRYDLTWSVYCPLLLMRNISIRTAIKLKQPQQNVSTIHWLSHLGCGHLLSRGWWLLHPTEEAICRYDRWCWAL